MTDTLTALTPTPSDQAPRARRCTISSEPGATSRVRHGVDLLTAALRRHGYEIHEDTEPTDPAEDHLRIVVGARSTGAVRALEEAEVLLYNDGAPGRDGYYLSALPGRQLVVTGADDSGVLYGCQELARLLDRHGDVPWDLDGGETPDLALRGPAIGLQKTTVEPPRQVYEYPITPERFPWFYDREHWTDLLDRLFEQRANVVYLWSGHPFSSFVRLPDHPEALEVTDAELAANRDTLTWLTSEADRRGIAIAMKFYNIHIPLPFAEHHQIPLRQPRPTPLVSAYTRAAISQFVIDFPGVGLYVCLGEVLQADLYGEEWLLGTILPAVSDALEATGRDEWPIIILRTHHIDPGPVVTAAREVCPRLYTEGKYNGESLTTWNPRGAWQQQHRFLSSLDSTHIANVHILANLEPFRYGAVTFIRRSVVAMKHRLGANGLHLYPLFYWDWPHSPDRSEPRLRQLDRDWIWYDAWMRYAWRAERDPEAEQEYWSQRLAVQFGSPEAGRGALQAYEAMGQIAPRLLRRLGITEGNRQTFSLGMTMSQLTNPAAHRPWPDLWESHAPAGERLETYVRRELAGLPHVGETPLDVVRDSRHFAALARRAIDRAAPHVHRDGEEFERLRDDVRALSELTEFYALRVLAAIEIVSYREGHRDQDPGAVRRLQRAGELVQDSLEHYRRLTSLTAERYRYANSMRTPQRRVPFPDGSAHGHWTQCLPRYEAEAANLRDNVTRMLRGQAVGPRDAGPAAKPYRPLAHDVLGTRPRLDLRVGARVFDDVDATIERLAPELSGLQGVALSWSAAPAEPQAVELHLPEPGRVLIGYFDSTDPRYLQVPHLETDTHADERGGLDPVLVDALQLTGHPPVNVHAFAYEAGRHTIAPGRGAFLLLGVVAADQELGRPGVERPGATTDPMDWLYEAPTEGDRA